MLQSHTRFQIGKCQINFGSGEFVRDGESTHLDARIARLLMHFAHRPNEVISVDELLDQVWEGVVVSQDSVYQAVTALRKLLGDDAKNPAYIETVPRRGYRLIAPVTLLNAPSTTAIAPDQPVARPPANQRRWFMAAAAATAVAVAAGCFAVWGPAMRAQRTTHSIVVLPFLDLTDSMTEEPFADGMVEELISRLGKTAGMSVAPAADSFRYKDKDVDVVDVARTLHADYALEGSVRKSGDTLRVAVRLIRASDHVVVWSETYDRPWQDKLRVQNEIAEAVSRAMATSF